MNSGTNDATGAISFRAAFRFWLKLGFVSFGGPAGQIAVMHEELVVRRRWISERRFLHALNFCMLLPGPEAQQLATYIGWLLHRSWGGIIAGSLFVLPSLVLLTALAWAYLAFGHLPWLAAVFYGVKPAVVAIVAAAAWRVGTRVLRNAWLGLIALAAFAAIFALQIPFPWIIVAAAIIGFVGGRLSPGRFAPAVESETKDPVQSRAVIDDDTPPPAHARVSWTRTIGIATAVLLLWAGAMAALIASQGTGGTLTQMAWFFTKAAFLTFGGAYAVLPYVYQGAVVKFGWLTSSQMIDGLALGETTPGPLIMVVAFVGYVGAATNAASPAFSPLAAGILGSLTATYFTFLPSLLLILVGAPIVEGTRANLTFAAPLTAITAAVVGVILNLALFFALHVFWPRGFDGGIDVVSAILCAAALIAILRFKLGVIAVVLASALIGLLLAAFRPLG